MTRPTQPTFLQLFPRAIAAGLLLMLVDAVVARLNRGPGELTLELELEALRLGFSALTALYLVLFGLLCACGARLIRSWGAAAGALGVLLLVLVLDVGLQRFDAIRAEATVPGAMGALLPTVLFALIAAAASYLVLLGRTSAELSSWKRSTSWLLFGALVVVSILPRLPGVARSEDDRPERAVTSGHAVERVILIVADTLRADSLRCYDPDAAPTPALDALAGEGIRFTDPLAPSPWTLPSMTSILTGAHPLVHGTVTRTSSLPRALPTLAERMSGAGYRTGAIGHNFVLGPARRLNRGFDTYDFDERRGRPARSLGFLLLGFTDVGAPLPELEAAEINEKALAWLDEHGDEDFFLWLHYYDPHLVYDPPEDLRPPGAPPQGRRYQYDHEDFKRARSGEDVPDTVEREWIRDLYAAEVRSLDRELGRLFDELRARDLWDGTLIVFTSDHGEELWEHGGFEHGHTLYEELLAVPLIVKLPGSNGVSTDLPTGAPAVSHGPVSIESIYPTILTLCGLDAESPGAGPLLDARGAPLERVETPTASTGTLYGEDRISVRFDGWKYVRVFSTGEEELYHLGDDPGEEHSLASSAPEELAQGRAHCDQLLAAAEELRAELGVAAESAELTEEDRATLNALGYAQE